MVYPWCKQHPVSSVETPPPNLVIPKFRILIVVIRFQSLCILKLQFYQRSYILGHIAKTIMSEYSFYLEPSGWVGGGGGVNNHIVFSSAIVSGTLLFMNRS